MTDRKPPRPPAPPNQGHPAGAATPQRPRTGPPRGIPGDLAHVRPAPQRPNGKGGNRRAAAPPPRGRSFAGTALLAVLGLIVVGIGAGAAYLYFAPPVDFIRSQIVAQVKAKTGRDLVIGGPAKMSFYPSLAVSLEKVSLSAPPGMGGPPTLRIKSLDVAVKLLPLFSRQVVVDQLVMHVPEVEARIDKNGRKSWQLAAYDDAAPMRFAQAPSTISNDAAPVAPAPKPAIARPAAAGSIAALEQLQLGNVRTVAGVVRYSDERSGARYVVAGIDMQFSAAGISSPLEARGSLMWQAQATRKVDIDATLTSMKSILENAPAKLAVTLSHKLGKTTFDGTVNVAASEAEGALKGNTTSLAQLAQLFGGVVLPADKSFGAASVDGRLKANASGATLSDATLGLDGAIAKGTTIVDVTGPRPLVKANLKISELDLNKYMAGGAAPAASQPTAPAPAAAGAPAAPGAPAAKPTGDAIEDLLKKNAGPQVKGFTQRDGWSDEPINVAALGAADVDARLAIAKLIFQEIKVGPTQLAVALKDRVLKTTFEDVQLYQGRGRGVISLDGGAASPVLGANFLIENVASLPLLRDAADIDWLAGTGKLAIAVAGQGASQRKIIETLNGKADFTFANGAIVGWNFPGLIRNLQQGKFSGLSKSPSEKTDFSELSAGWTIANGIASNQDLKLTSPLLRLSGAGRVMLPTREIDYVARPKVVASLEGQGGAGGLSGLEIPVKITGGWQKPQITPDVGGVLKDPNQAIGAIKELGKQFKGEKGREALKNLLGKDAEGNPVKPKQLLDQLIKR